MSMKSLETAILAEARIVTKIKKLRMKDIMEWSSGVIEAHDGETLIRLPELGINVAYKL